MIDVNKAMSLVLEHSCVSPKESVAIESSKFSVLAESVSADRAYPPFDRVALDGIAVHHSQFELLKGSGLPILGCQQAGEAAKELRVEGGCLEAMTGAPLPVNADTIVPYEHFDIRDGKAFLKKDMNVSPGQNIHGFGVDHGKGERLIEGGEILDPLAWSVLATVGCAEPLTYKKPRIAIVATGDEIVHVRQQPEAFQIRMSNTWAIKSMLQGFHYHDTDVFHLRDDQDELLEGLAKIIKAYDVLILSGGVSMGKYDFIPKILSDLKIKILFHKVAQKPGKPLLFGVSPDKVRVFGLPGNPVSAMICCRRYVIPSLMHSEKQSDHSTFIKLGRELSFKKNLSLFKPVKIRNDEQGMFMADPVDSNGSGDFTSLLGSSGFLELPQGRDVFLRGEAFPFYSWSGAWL